jgi:hypothetical protein
LRLLDGRVVQVERHGADARLGRHNLALRQPLDNAIAALLSIRARSLSLLAGSVYRVRSEGIEGGWDVNDADFWGRVVLQQGKGILVIPLLQGH